MDQVTHYSKKLLVTRWSISKDPSSPTTERQHHLARWTANVGILKTKTTQNTHSYVSKNSLLFIFNNYSSPITTALQHLKVCAMALWGKQYHQINQLCLTDVTLASCAQTDSVWFYLHQHQYLPSRKEPVTKAGMVPQVSCWMSLSVLPGRRKSNGGCCELAWSYHQHSLDTPSFSCCSWAQAVRTWKPPLPYKQDRKHGWRDTTQEVDQWGVDKAQHKGTWAR